jgi:hypothetical protein
MTAAFRDAKARFRATLMLLQSASGGVRLRISPAATRNAWVRVTGCHRSCAWACKGFSLVFGALNREVAASPAALACGNYDRIPKGGSKRSNLAPEHEMTVKDVEAELSAEGYVLDHLVETLPRQHMFFFRRHS